MLSLLVFYSNINQENVIQQGPETYLPFTEKLFLKTRHKVLVCFFIKKKKKKKTKPKGYRMVFLSFSFFAGSLGFQSMFVNYTDLQGPPCCDNNL
jgi:hypothetical protein